MAYKRTYDEYDGWDADEEFYEEEYRPRRHASAPAGGARRTERKRSPRRTACLGSSAMAAVLMTVFSLGLCIGRLALPNEAAAPGTGQSGQNAELSGTGTDGAQTGEEKLAYIQSETTKYPQALRELVQKNPETLDFVYDYPINSTLTPEIDLSAEASGGTVPLLLQWDERWGYRSYGSGLIGYTGCGPTCLSMVALYLTGDANCDPGTVAQYAQQQGYYVEGSGTAWEMMATGCAHFGLKSEEIGLDENEMAAALADGKVLICSMGPGDFTDGGHYIVLTGHSDAGFSICDPNSPKRSAQTWTFDRLKNQIRNVWAFHKA